MDKVKASDSYRFCPDLSVFYQLIENKKYTQNLQGTLYNLRLFLV